MENDFPIVDLGPATRGHLDRFRSFLLKYYHGKFVHWPPLQTPQFSKPLYKSMHLDFLALFHYLVDYDSANLRYPEDLGEVGGINVLHHITKFNTQHGYKPLPYSMPLIPRAPLYAKAKSQRRSIALNLKASHLPRNRKRPVQSSLRSAANTEDIRALESPLVRDYMVFERDSAVHIEGLSLQDARRVCWILVYCVLQELISVTSVPKMVRDIDKSTYPLCVDTSDLLPWKEGESAVYRISPASNIDISRRNSIIKNSPLPCYCEINVHGYGNGLKNFSVETISRTTIDLSLPPVLLSKSPTKNTFKSSFSDYSSDSVSDYSVSDCSASDCSPSDYSASDCSPSDYSASDYSASAGCNSNSDYSASKDFTSENLTSKYSSSNLFASDYDFDNPRSNNSSHEELYPKPLRVRTSGPKQLNSVGHKINYRSNRLYLDLSSV
jgi:hypothetical protein